MALKKAHGFSAKPVPIRDEYLTGLPFSLKTRHGVAIVFSYYGDSEDVLEFMSKCSHTTRAYFKNADRLKGFLIHSIAIRELRKAEANGDLVEVTKH